jgi:hypothetical protein
MKNQRNRKSLSEMIREDLELAKEEGVRFMTFNVATEDKSKTAGRIVAAYYFQENKDDENFDELCIQFSFCSPRDTFDRKFGEFVACRRLYSACNEITAKSTKQLIRPIVAINLIEEAHRRNVPWMRTVQVKDLR